MHSEGKVCVKLNKQCRPELETPQCFEQKIRERVYKFKYSGRDTGSMPNMEQTH